MTRAVGRTWSTFGTAFLIACGLALVINNSSSVQASTAQEAESGAADDPLTPGGGYVGAETCLGCHSDQTVTGTPHGNPHIPGSPEALQSCESCHGPGERHVDDDEKRFIRKFSKMPPRDVSETCVTCHNRSEHALWDSSAHNARNLSCTTCHSVHDPASGRGLLVKGGEMEVCGTCHKPQVMKQQRASHMPVREGKMTCSTCHNPHGATNVRMLRVGNYINESCVSCHAEKRGPFLWEHAAGRESCSTCHDPHGSNNDRMLVARTPALCQRCHIGTRHPSTIYDGTSLAQRSNRLIQRGCINCHQQIHGSNHPSGVSLAR